MIYSIMQSEKLSKKWLLPVAVSVLSAWHGLVFLGLIAVFISISFGGFDSEVMGDGIHWSYAPPQRNVVNCVDVYVAGLGMTLFLLPWFLKTKK